MGEPLEFDFNLEEDIIPQVEEALKKIDKKGEEAKAYRLKKGLSEEEAEKEVMPVVNNAKMSINNLIKDTFSYLRLQNERLLRLIESRQLINEFILTVVSILITVFLLTIELKLRIFFIVILIASFLLIVLSIQSILPLPKKIAKGFKMPMATKLNEYICMKASDLEIEKSFFSAYHDEIDKRDFLFKFIKILLYPYLIMIFFSTAIRMQIGDIEGYTDFILTLSTACLIIIFAGWFIWVKKLPEPKLYLFGKKEVEKVNNIETDTKEIKDKLNEIYEDINEIYKYSLLTWFGIGIAIMAFGLTIYGSTLFDHFGKSIIALVLIFCGMPYLVIALIKGVAKIFSKK